MASLTLVTPPDVDVEPITLDEAKSHCRVDIDRDDALLTGLIVAAREQFELLTGRQVFTAVWALKLDGWPCWIDVPKAPLLSSPAVAITYLDTAGTTQTLATTQYRVDAPVGPTAARGIIEPAYGVTWPSLYLVSNNVTVTFSAGYGATRDAVPAMAKQAMLLWLLPEYQRRTMTDDERRAFRARIAMFSTWARQRQ